MKGKKLLTVVGVICLALVVISLLFIGACAKPAPAPASSPFHIELRHASWTPTTNVMWKQEMWWCNEVTKRTEGRVEFEHFPGGALCGTRDQLSGIKSGLFDVGPFMSAMTPGETPLWTIDWQYWGLTADPVILVKAKRELSKLPAMEEELAKWNAKFLYAPYGYPRIIMSKKPIYKVEDFKGLKIRCSGRQARAFELVGANPISMPAVDIYDALQKGTIEATEMPYLNLVTYGVDEVCEYVILINLPGASPNAAISLDVFNKLPADIQKIMMEVAEEADTATAEYQKMELEEAIKESDEAGKQIFIDFPPEEREKFLEVCAWPVMQEWIEDMVAKGQPGTEVFEAWRDAQEKCMEAAK